MKLIVQGKQMRVSTALKRYAEEHVLQPLRRFYDNEAAELRVSSEGTTTTGASRRSAT